MANIPIRDIPGAVVASPDPSNLIPMDNGSLMQKTTIANAVNTTLPLSSQAEAEAGVDNAKRMSSLRTKQAIDAQTPAIVNVAITALNLGTMSQEDASDYTPTSGLAAVALSNDYEDLDNRPTLGTAAATDASDYATAAQGAAADTAIQPGDPALVPAGGTTSQVLIKSSNTDYDTEWTTSASATAVSYAPQTLSPSEQAQARVNIGLGDAATKDVGAGPGTVAAGDDSRIVGAVQTSRSVSTQHSLTGGGNLSANRTLSLVNDTASPGNNKVYGTNASGVRGWVDPPANVYTGSTQDETNFPVGHTVAAVAPNLLARNASGTVRLSGTEQYTLAATGTALSGVWRARGMVQVSSTDLGNIMQRVS